MLHFIAITVEPCICVQFLRAQKEVSFMAVHYPDNLRGVLTSLCRIKRRMWQTAQKVALTITLSDRWFPWT